MAETDKILFPCKDSFQFPIGYILMSASKINPATFLNYGKWALLGSGRTILGAGDTDNGKEIGGSFSKILTEANIPAHTHSLPSHTHQIPAHNHTASSNKINHNHDIYINNGGNHAHSMGSAGSHTHGWYANINYPQIHKVDQQVFSFLRVNDYFNTSSNEIFGINSAGTHTHGINSAGTHNHTASSTAWEHNHTVTVANKAAFNTSNGGGGSSGPVGSGVEFDITPSYIKLFIWERIK